MPSITLVLILAVGHPAMAQSELEGESTLPCIPRSMIPPDLQYAGTLDLSHALAPEFAALQDDLLSAVKLKLDFGGSHAPLTLVFRDASGRALYKLSLAEDVHALPIRGLLTKNSNRHPVRIEVYIEPKKDPLSLKVQLAIERTKAGAQNYYGVKGIKSKPSKEELAARTSTLAIPVSTSSIAPQPCPEKSPVPTEPNCANCDIPAVRNVEASDSLIHSPNKKPADKKSEEILVVKAVAKQKAESKQTLAAHKIQLRDFGVKANLAYNKNKKKCPKTPDELARWLGLKNSNDLLVVMNSASKAYRNKEYKDDPILKVAKEAKKSFDYLEIPGCQYLLPKGTIHPVTSYLDLDGDLESGVVKWDFGINGISFAFTGVPDSKNPGVWIPTYSDVGNVPKRVTINVADGVLLILEVDDEKVYSFGFAFVKEAIRYPGNLRNAD